MQRRRSFLLSSLGSIAPAVASAQSVSDYPSRALQLYTPFPGFNDATARMIAEKLAEDLRQPVVVQNLPGAAGSLAAARVKAASPDGYTLLFGSNGMFTINELFNPNLEYKASDFHPISLAYSHGLFLLAHPSVPANNLAELLAYAKANPGSLTYGTSGIGSVTHMCGEMLASMSGTQLTHVPYKGTAQALTDLIGGRISLLFFPPQEALQHVNAGRVKVLAYSTSARSKSMPNVPTIAEAGIPGYDMKVWYGFFASSSIPPAAMERLSQSVPKAVAATDLASRDLVPVGNTPAQFQALIQHERGTIRKLMETAGIKP